MDDYIKNLVKEEVKKALSPTNALSSTIETSTLPNAASTRSVTPAV